MIGHDGRLRLVGHRQVFTLVDRHQDLEVAHVQMIAVEQTPRIAFADRLALVVHVHAVGADVDDVVNAALAVDRCVFPGDELVGVGQDPVVVQGAADGAALRPEFTHGIVADDVPMFADDFQFERHTGSILSPPHGVAPCGRWPNTNTAPD